MAYKILPQIDPEQFPPIKGLEGPFRMKNGMVVYYDTMEGKYYNPRNDMYLSNEEIVNL